MTYKHRHIEAGLAAGLPSGAAREYGAEHSHTDDGLGQDDHIHSPVAPAPRSLYQRAIAEVVDPEQIDPRHVEAYMRDTYRTLDGLSPMEFLNAVLEARNVAALAGPEASEALAQSWGL
jgi:hypothetical protein